MRMFVKKRSYWHDTCQPRRFLPLDKDRAFDVVVVGAGITGLTTAYFLKQKGLSVGVLELGEIAAGTSGATTAHASAQYDHGYSSLVAAHGKDSASLVQSSLTSAINTIEQVAKDLELDCGFQRVPGYFYTETKVGAETVSREFQAAIEAGMQVELVEKVPLPFKTWRGFRVKNQARFHPVKYLNGLADAIQGDGCHIFTGTRVTNIKDGDPCKVETGTGFTVTGQNVVLATHTPLGFTLLQASLIPKQSFVLTAKVNDLPDDGLFWDTEDPYNYTRIVGPPGQGLVMIGGRDFKTAHGDESRSFAELEHYVRQHYAVKEIVHQWSAQFFEPTGHMPSIGKRPGSGHVYLATGFSGNGITLGTVSGHILAEQIVGHLTEWDEVYRPERFQLRGLKPFLTENFDVAMSFVGDRINLAEAVDLRDLAPGSGRIVEADGKQIAAYRAESGDLRSFSAVCPHLGCIVRWNGEQKSFDCPCHGSRFDLEGQVIEGPTLAGLRRIEIQQMDSVVGDFAPQSTERGEAARPT